MIKSYTFILWNFILLSLIIGSCKARVRESDKDEKLPEQQPVVKQDEDKISEQFLRDAAMYGKPDEIKAAVISGVNVNAIDADGRTALMYASFNGYTDIVRILLEHGADVKLADFSGRTALLFASSGDFPETVRLLLDHGAEPNIADITEKYTPLMFAAAEGHLEVVKILLEYNADPNLKDKDDDDAEIFARQNGHLQVADFLKSVMK